jgi:hypothetical protein
MAACHREGGVELRRVGQRLIWLGDGVYLAGEAHAGRGCKVLAQAREVGREVVPVVLVVFPGTGRQRPPRTRQWNHSCMQAIRPARRPQVPVGPVVVVAQSGPPQFPEQRLLGLGLVLSLGCRCGYRCRCRCRCRCWWRRSGEGAGEEVGEVCRRVVHGQIRDAWRRLHVLPHASAPVPHRPFLYFLNIKNNIKINRTCGKAYLSAQSSCSSKVKGFGMKAKPATGPTTNIMFYLLYLY